MLYNLSHKDVCLHDDEAVMKLELIRLEADTSKPYDNSRSKTATLSQYIDVPLIRSLVDIRKPALTLCSAGGFVAEVRQDQQLVWRNKTGLR
jgi:hypothetical protein